MKNHIKPAKGIYLDKIGEMRAITRHRFKAIPLILGWKLVKEESDDVYRQRMIEIMSRRY